MIEIVFAFLAGTIVGVALGVNLCILILSWQSGMASERSETVKMLERMLEKS